MAAKNRTKKAQQQQQQQEQQPKPAKELKERNDSDRTVVTSKTAADSNKNRKKNNKTSKKNNNIQQKEEEVDDDGLPINPIGGTRMFDKNRRSMIISAATFVVVIVAIIMAADRGSGSGSDTKQEQGDGGYRESGDGSGRRNHDDEKKGDGDTRDEESTGSSSSTRSSSSSSSSSSSRPPFFARMGTYELLDVIEHDPSSFTQGLVTGYHYDNHETVDDGSDGRNIKKSKVIYESTGLYGESKVRILNMTSIFSSSGDIESSFFDDNDDDNNVLGSVVLDHDLPGEFFGEGMCTYMYREGGGGGIDVDNDQEGGRTGRAGGEERELLIQLTWKENIGFIYDPTDLSVVRNFTYETTTNEGWGITYDPGRHVLYVSDGSANILTWDANTLQPILTTSTSVENVYYQRIDMKEPILMPRINELEFDTQTDSILANIWYQDFIIRIDIQTKYVTTVYDLRSLYTNRIKTADCLNGIALVNVINNDHRDNDTTTSTNTGGGSSELWVTGKKWPKMYRIRLIEPQTV